MRSIEATCSGNVAKALGAAALLLAGCESVPLAPDLAGDHPSQAVLMRFYEQYAPLAAHVYTTRGLADNRLNLAFASAWIRREESRAGEAAPEGSSDAFEHKLEETLQEAVAQVCTQPRPSNQVQGESFARGVADGTFCDQRSEDALVFGMQPREGVVEFTNAEPTGVEECRVSGEGRAPVPLALVQKDHGWEAVTELSKYASTRGWRIFVPQLAIDVWRRSRNSSAEAPAVEYAIVYRGTVGSGGWVSNLRVITAALPLFWDQYEQARHATRHIVEQIYHLHTISDRRFEQKRNRKRKTEVLITGVGHSLGAGLAAYSYFRVPEMTRVVGFNSTPVTGARTMIPLEERGAVTAPESRKPADVEPSLAGGHAPAIYLLHEHGEILSRIAACTSGPVWGNEGGPVIRCDEVRLDHGNTFRQHAMARFACHIAHEVKRLATSRTASGRR